ncbi:acyl-CoA dehydrogenase family protein [Shouchella lonarensis]|uniref:Acyl-CoA dehydrogenase n=1 Tax=Shouchella lonarensis TaxID=1464122 RepID=A0A1G6KGT7_9BACI|nr:acyl-CoA dehydrogenase family protein [Shouchella lonarensis]SDC30240.1 Acyl-CoA dehydrogenase [Shouchella lonarensis]
MQFVADPLMEELQKAMRFTLSQTQQDGKWEDLIQKGLLGFEVPVEQGGYGFGMKATVAGCEELGTFGCTSLCIDWMTAIDAVKTLKPTLDGNLLSSAMDGRTKVGFQLVSDSRMQVKHTEKTPVLHGSGHFMHTPNMDGWVIAAKQNEMWLIAYMPAGSFKNLRERHNIADVDAKEMDLLEAIIDQKYLLAEVAAHDEQWQQLFSRLYLRQSAYLLGLAKGAHKEAVRYANMRKQFDKRLIENQVVSNQLAHMYGEIEAISTKLSYTAWLHDSDASLTERVLYATELLASVGELVLQVTKKCLHLHGAYGLTARAPIQKYYRLAAFEAVRLGTPVSLWMDANEMRTRHSIVNHL